jgi:hypothetical protein
VPELLLDSVILIDHLNDLDQATLFISRLKPADTAISVITRAEILTGTHASDLNAVVALLNQYQLLGIDIKAADKAANLRKEHGWKLPDAFQAALALNCGLKLVTRNTKDFDPLKHPFVLVPYEI